MSWEEQLSARMKITTGDGKTYEPYHMIDTHQGSYEFNVAEFEYPEIRGTHVDRREAKGVRYPLEFFFQGEDNIDQMKEFVISSWDKRAWTIIHPIYGTIIGHPLAVAFDNAGINTAKISCTVVESIDDTGPRTSFDPRKQAPLLVMKAQESNAEFFSQVQPTVSDVNQMKQNVASVYKTGSAAVTDDAVANEYFNLYNAALSKVNNAFSDVADGITIINDFLAYPALFKQSVKFRLNTLIAQAMQLTLTLENVFSPNEKKIFESQKGSIVSAAITTVVTPMPTDYNNANDVISVIESVLFIYNNYIAELQNIQSPTGGDIDSYQPDAGFMSDLNYSVNYAVSNLFAIALNAEQERTFFLEEDSNVIVQAHRFYGMEPDDSTLMKFIETNNIGLNEVLELKKGRKLLYYI